MTGLPEELAVSPPLGERSAVVAWLRARREYRIAELGWSHDDAWIRYTDEYGLTRRAGGRWRVRDGARGIEFVEVG